VLAHVRAGSSAAATADALGWTVRALHRRCRDAFGYGPSVLRRILRFRMALRLAGQGIPFAATAACAGYADQAHLAREVHALAGVPLGQLVRGELVRGE
jgi:AraC-like DNA-binding protein